MSIKSLCSGDRATIQAAAHSVGASGGDVRTWSDVRTIDCLVQTDSTGESRANAARGQVSRFSVYCSSDPGLTQNHRLKWIVRAGNRLAAPLYLRVLAVESAGRPGQDLLWCVECELDTTRCED
jgi:hypothetical protein